MVERPQQQYSVELSIIVSEVAGVAELSTEARKVAEPASRLLDMSRNRVDQRHIVAIIDKPLSVNPASSADVEDLRPAGWETARNNLTSSNQLELSDTTADASILVILRGVEPQDLIV